MKVLKNGTVSLKADRKCFFCSKPLLYAKEDTCPACEKESKKMQAEHIAREKVKFGKRKCQGCDKPLPVGRYFHCTVCLNEENEDDPQIYKAAFTKEEYSRIKRYKPDNWAGSIFNNDYLDEGGEDLTESALHVRRIPV